MEIRQLEYFCAVSALESFTKAANFLHVSQPSVTKTVQALETELNLELFDRSQKQICLTAAGEVFLLHAKKILREVSEAQFAMEKFSNATGGVIRLGLPPMVESYLFPKFFLRLKSKNPEINLQLIECNSSAEVQEKILRDELDFGIIFSQADELSKNSMTLLEDEFLICMAANHKLARAEKISFADLKSEKFILQPQGTVQNLLTLKFSAEASFAPEILLFTSQLHTIKDLVSSGAAISLLPKFAVKNSTNLISKSLTPPLKFKINLIWNGLKELSTLGKKFVTAVSC